MTLLKLAPDSERLRRIARAYAAGEVEEKEYRRIRAEVIDAFAMVDHADDDTQQRWSEAKTVTAQNVVAPPGTRAELPVSRRNHWWLGAGLAVCALSTVLYFLM